MALKQVYLAAAPPALPPEELGEKYVTKLASASARFSGIADVAAIDVRLVIWVAALKQWIFHDDLAVSGAAGNVFTHVYKDLLGIETSYAMVRANGTTGEATYVLEGSRL